MRRIIPCQCAMAGLPLARQIATLEGKRVARLRVSCGFIDPSAFAGLRFPSFLALLRRDNLRCVAGLPSRSSPEEGGKPRVSEGWCRRRGLLRGKRATGAFPVELALAFRSAFTREMRETSCATQFSAERGSSAVALRWAAAPAPSAETSEAPDSPPDRRERPRPRRAQGARALSQLSHARSTCLERRPSATRGRTRAVDRQCCCWREAW